MKYVLKLNAKKNKLTLVNKSQRIALQTKKQNIRLRQTGLPGRPGDKGEPGFGLPTGGTTGQIIVKQTDDDYDFGFASPNSLADKNYVQNFSVLSTVIVTHNLNKYPSPVIFDTAGDEVEGVVEYLDPNTLRLRFSSPFSGTVTCN